MNALRPIGLLLLLVAAPVDCSHAQQPGGDPARLQGRWALVSVDGKPMPGLPAYFEIDGQRINGFDGCNTFGGSLDRPAMIRKGQRDCPGQAPFPLALDDPSRQLDDARVNGDIMTLPIPGDTGTAVFHRD